MAKLQVIHHRLLGEVEVEDIPEVGGRFFFSPLSKELVGYESEVYVGMRRDLFEEKHIPPFGEFTKKEEA